MEKIRRNPQEHWITGNYLRIPPNYKAVIALESARIVQQLASDTVWEQENKNAHNNHKNYNQFWNKGVRRQQNKLGGWKVTVHFFSENNFMRTQGSLMRKILEQIKNNASLGMKNLTENAAIN